MHEFRPMRDFKSLLPETEKSRRQNSTDTAELNSSIITAYFDIHGLLWAAPEEY